MIMFTHERRSLSANSAITKRSTLGTAGDDANVFTHKYESRSSDCLDHSYRLLEQDLELLTRNPDRYYFRHCETSRRRECLSLSAWQRPYRSLHAKEQTQGDRYPSFPMAPIAK